MSQILREYEDYNKKRLYVTAYVGPNWNKSVQLTIYDGNYYFVNLSEKQIRDLIEILQGRLDGKYTATGDECYPHKLINIDGEIIGEED